MHPVLSFARELVADFAGRATSPGFGVVLSSWPEAPSSPQKGLCRWRSNLVATPPRAANTAWLVLGELSRASSCQAGRCATSETTWASSRRRWRSTSSFERRPTPRRLTQEFGSGCPAAATAPCTGTQHATGVGGSAKRSPQPPPRVQGSGEFAHARGGEARGAPPQSDSKEAWGGGGPRARLCDGGGHDGRSAPDSARRGQALVNTSHLCVCVSAQREPWAEQGGGQMYVDARGRVC